MAFSIEPAIQFTLARRLAEVGIFGAQDPMAVCWTASAIRDRQRVDLAQPEVFFVTGSAGLAFSVELTGLQACRRTAATAKLDFIASMPSGLAMNANAINQHLPSRLTPAELRTRWLRMLEDPVLADVPGKLELNEKGTIELSPANTRHSILQAFVSRELHRLRPDGTAMTECGIETQLGVRVPDVAWASREFMRRHGTDSPLPHAPELCVEVLSPSNSVPEMKQKIAAYLAAGAIEVWLVAEDGTLEMFDEHGSVATSRLGIAMEIAP